MTAHRMHRGLNVICVLALLVLSLPVTGRSLSPLNISAAPLGTEGAPLVSTRSSHLYAPGEVLVRLRPTARQGLMEDGSNHLGLDAPSLNRLNAIHGLRVAVPLFPQGTLAQPQLEQVRSSEDSDLGHIYRLTFPAHVDVARVVTAYAADANVEWAEPNYIARPALVPNDPLYADQWGLPQIDAAAAWDVTTGSPQVIIAVIDSGIDLTHPDLQPNLWINPGEIAGNGIDDDNNGYVDDVRGWNFVTNSNNVYDGNGHGTQVAGVAAAVANNGVGIAGACWNCRIMPVRVMADSGISNYSDIALGVKYAADKGAKVINLSLGGYAYSNALRDAINYAVNVKDAVVVAGAGNDNISTPFYPAAYDNVLAVAGTTDTDTKADFSDYGTWVDVSAPAVEIMTTYLGGDWGTANGTSLSAPLVAGIAGLIRSENPGWSAALARNQILQTADVIDLLNPAYAGQLGAGRIHAARAMQPPHPLIQVASTVVNGDPLGRPTPGQAATVAVTLRNDWWDALGVTATLATTDPYVTLTTAIADYGSLPSGATGMGNPTFAFTVAAGAGYNHAIAFTLTVRANSGAYQVSLPLTITTRSGDEHFCGTVTQNMVWTNDKTYILDCNVGIAPGYTLTIEAGTDVQFAGNYSLNVGGTLVADGTASRPIRFRPRASGSWGRIFFDDPSTDALATADGIYQSGNLLRHVRIDGATQGIACSNATPYLDHVLLSGGGVTCAGGDRAVWIKDSDLSGNMQITKGSGVDALSWVSGTPMPAARWDLAAATGANGRIYVAGGENSQGILAILEEYDPSTSVWTTKTPMPTARRGLALVAAPNGRLYAIGGDNGATLSTVEEYDPETDTWQPRAPMLTARMFLSAAAAPNDRVYVFGGYPNSADSVEEYDLATDTWQMRAPMPTARWNSAAVTAPNGRIYVVGGYRSVRFPTVEEYDPTTDTWATRMPMPSAREWLAAALAPDGHIYAIGGYYITGQAMATVEEYDPTLDLWRSRADMPTPRYAMAAAVAPNGRLYVIGGQNTDTLATMDIFTPDLEDEGPAYAYNLLRTSVRGALSLPAVSAVMTSTVTGNASAGTGSLIQSVIASGSIAISGAGTVRNSTAGSGISLTGGTVESSTVQNGGISVGSGSAVSNTVTGGSISLSNGGTASDNNIEDAPAWGLMASGSITVTRNRLVGCANGIKTSGGVISENLIANVAGVGLEIGSATVISNTFTSIGGSAIKISSGMPGLIAGNNFEFNTGTYDVQNLVPKTALMTVDARNNWWGTIDTTAIRQRIFDFNDDYTIGTVLYVSVMSAPSRTAPAYVREIMLSPESPVGIQTVQFSVEFSREMDTVVFPTLTFADSRGETITDLVDGLCGRHIRHMASDAFHNIWIATYDGGSCKHSDDGSWTYYPFGAEFVFPDGQGGAWFASWDAGAYHVLSDGTLNDPLRPVSDVIWIGKDDVGNLWFAGNTGNQRGGIARLNNDGSFTVFDYRNSPINDAQAALVDKHNNIWVSVPYQGLYKRLPDGRWILHSPQNSSFLCGDDQNGNGLMDSTGDMWWVCGYHGVTRITSAGGWINYTPSNSPLGQVRRMNEDWDGNIWIGHTGGVSLLGRDGSWVVYPSNEAHSGLCDVHGIAFQNPEDTWIGSYWGCGVSIIHRPTLHFEYYSPRWVSGTTFSALHDITGLIPRGIYELTVNGARMRGNTDPDANPLPTVGSGMEIAPNNAYTFTVDYAGYINDTTAPFAPWVSACAAATADTLSGEWSANDPESAIDRYQYAIGVAPGGTEVVNWTFTPLTATIRSGLSLIVGHTYYFSVRARNEAGLWSQASSIGIAAGSGTCAETELTPPEVDFDAVPRSGTAPLQVQFTSAVTGEVTTYAWTFGDGGVAATPNPAHTYTSAGSFDVTLIITGPGGTAQVVKPGYVTVSAAPGTPTVTFSAIPRSGTAPLQVQFTSVITGEVTTYAWTFGDGGVAATPNPVHTYTSAGSFDVTLIATGPGGIAQLVKAGYVTVSPVPGTPTVTFSANTVVGTVPLTVTFTAITTGMVESWHWVFGDGNEAFTGPIVQHTYTAPGTFDVGLTVANSNGSYMVNKPAYVMATSTNHRVYLPLALRH